jgi:opacity protein-like surface antigen
MKRTLACSVVVFSVTFSVISFAGPAFSAQIRIGASVNYFMPSDSAYKDLYGRGGIAPAGSLSLELLRRLELRAEVGYFQDDGKMSLTREDIKLKLTTAALGVRYRIVDSRMVAPYAGIGLTVCSYKVDLPPRLTGVSKSAAGFEAEAGTYINAAGRLFLDLNFRFFDTDAKAQTGTVKLGGVRFGLGIGYRF